MALVDILIILLILSAILRGSELGLVRQLLPTAGFFGGLWLGALLGRYTVQYAHTPLSRSLVSLVTVLFVAITLLSTGEAIAIRLKNKVQNWRLHIANHLDNGLGAILSAVSVLVVVWLGTSVLTTLPFPQLQQQIRASRVVTDLTRQFPPAPTVIADIGRVIYPNGFPQVFTGNEPAPPNSIDLPSLGSVQPAINKVKASVVKIDGQGCGGVVEGSGFVIGPDLVATNAHVIAGITAPRVLDHNGSHGGTPIWFDPNLDFAILRVPNLSGDPLVFASEHVSRGTNGAILGYPGGGPLTAKPAVIIDEFTAIGRNIYNQDVTERDVYELHAEILPGNSGGPVIDPNGSVVGVVFAESTTYNKIGYALSNSEVLPEIHQATAQNREVSTGQCTR